MTRRALVAVLLVVAAAGLAAPAVTGQAATNATADYTLDQLRAPGDRIPGAAPSQRWVDGGSVWVDYEESNPLRSGGEEWAAEALLRRDSTVDANTLRLHFQVGRSVDKRQYEVVVVYYDVATEEYEVDVGNRTEVRERRVAANVTRQSRTVNVTSAFAVVEVPLTPHYDDGKRAVMCVQPADAAGDCIQDTDHPARWSGWTHRSVRATEGTDVSTVGGLLWWSAINVVGPAIGSVAAFGLVGYLLLSRAGAGPRIPALAYVFVGGPVLFIVLATGWDVLAGFVAAHPPVLGLVVGPVVGPLAAKTFNRGVRTLQLQQPDVTDATTATGDEGTDVLRWHVTELPIVDRLGDGRPVVARPGIVPFVMRLLGARTPVEWDARTEVDVTGDVRADQLAIIDPVAESAVEWGDGGLGLDTPDGGAAAWAGWLLKIGGVAVVGAAVADGLLGLWWLGLLAAVPVAVTARERVAEIPLASVHGRRAAATMLVGQKEASAAETLDEYRDTLWRERAKGEREVEDRMDDFRGTILDETLPGDVDATADPDGGGSA